MNRADCLALDRDDPLAAARERFHLPEGLIYLDGNSLGALPRTTPARLAEVLEQQWGEGLVRSWNTAGWVDAPARVAARLAPLLGAGPDQLMIADSTSINLFKLLWAATRLRPERRVVLMEAGDFPTDAYLAQALAALDPHVHVLRAAPEQLAALLDERVAVLLLSHVHYRTGARHDLAAWTARAHRVGALTLWDLAHSAGVLRCDLDNSGVDFAVGCGYKFLNGGPGAPSFLYVAARHQAAAFNPLQGWFGHARPFTFEADYQAAPGMARWQVGTPSILALAALEAALNVFRDLDPAQLEHKAQALGDIALAALEAQLPDAGFTVLTPREPTARGAQLSLAHPQAWPLCRALAAAGVLADYRPPGVLRMGFSPLLLRHVDVWDAVTVLAELWREGRWRAPQFQQPETVP